LDGSLEIGTGEIDGGGISGEGCGGEGEDCEVFFHLVILDGTLWRALCVLWAK
jgi:hypothetical protein